MEEATPAQDEQTITEAVQDFREALSDVVVSLDNLNKTLPTLRSEVDEKVNRALVEARQVELRASKTGKRLTAIVVAPLLALCLMVAAVGYAAYQNKQTADRIEDCTQPTGQCFQENRKSLAATVEAINKNTADQIKASLEVNHDDHEEVSYLFCKALVNAELPAPTDCGPILEAGPPPSQGK